MSQEIKNKIESRFIYVLQLEDGCYYIGSSVEKNFEQRMKKHFKRKGSRWTRLHKPTEIIEKRKIIGDYRSAELHENELTVDYMKKYGLDKVRGGFFAQVSEVEAEKCLKKHGYTL